MVNVLHLVEYLEQGGIERLLEQFARHTPQNLARLSIFTYETPQPSGIAKTIENLGVSLHYYKKKSGYDTTLVRKLIKVAKDEHIEVIHTHDFGPMEYAIALKMRFPRLRLIHTQHTVHNFVIFRKYVLFFQFAAQFYHQVCLVSESVKDELERCCPLAKRKFKTVYNGIDLNTFVVEKKKNEQLTLVNVSRISPEKNLVFLLQVLKQLKDESISFHFHHAGSGEENEERKIGEYIRDNQLEPYVTLHGFCHDVKPLLAMGDVFVSPSKTEGHPVAVLEAMATRCLCLLSRIPAHGFASDKEVKFFDLDSNQLFALLKDISQGNICFDSYLENAGKLVRESFSIENMIGHYAEIWNKR